MTFHPMFVHINLSSVRTAKWPPFWKELLPQWIICLLLVILVTSRFSFEGGN